MEFNQDSYCEFGGDIYFIQYAEEKLKIYMFNEKDYVWIFQSEHVVELEVHHVRSVTSASEITIILLEEVEETSSYYLYDPNIKSLTFQRVVDELYYEHLFIPDSIFD